MGWPTSAKVTVAGLAMLTVGYVAGHATPGSDDAAGTARPLTGGAPSTTATAPPTTTAAPATTVATTTAPPTTTTTRPPTTIAPPTTVAPTTAPPTTVAIQPLVPQTTAPANDVYYANCAAARQAGAAPLHRGDPGYRAGLDRDDDGVACE